MSPDLDCGMIFFPFFFHHFFLSLLFSIVCVCVRLFVFSAGTFFHSLMEFAHFDHLDNLSRP